MVKRISAANDDRFSHYFDPATYKRFQASSSGEFSGIGVTVTEAKKGLRVAQVFDGAPAKDANIGPDDLIVAVDGKSLAGVSADAAAARIKGPAGTSVELTVVDGASGKRRQVEVERANVKVPAVAGRIERVDGHEDRLRAASPGSRRGAHGELRSEIEKLDRRGAEGLVFDLRGNGGGLVDEAVLVQSIFQKEGPVLTIEGRTRDKQTFDVTGEPLEDIGPIAVLVDGNTASASEIVTAALKENDLATVIGTRTYGKGVFQEVIPLEAGGALDLTVGEYLTADGTSILGKGVVPDQRGRRQGPGRRRRRARRRPRSGRLRAAGQVMPDAAESGRPRALVVARRGRFWVGEPLFERGPQVSLARGRVNVDAGRDRALPDRSARRPADRRPRPRRQRP